MSGSNNIDSSRKENRGYKGNNIDNPLLAYNARLTPEERVEAAKKASRASVAARAKRKAERQVVEECSADLVTACIKILSGKRKDGMTTAEAVAARLSEIATTSDSERNILEASKLLSQITGQQAATKQEIVTRHTVSLDMSGRSEEELLRIVEGSVGCTPVALIDSQSSEDVAAEEE